ncbi:hypothetical protein Aspvir_009176 [Aspergillus viridinutans]|uniref:Glutamine amidotransferase domain-containing protein n=1 Tax=Aspergillus viridinutans TaxID=75553 RepID=A0A9P3BZZ7_ASPVI|nr:uncharacterized protein Aspvir_009176 [Aspergillus viridinutans]GIK05077.1 hypothetical protein Aspvir_009176 [Aspergillus viridinutans]
MPPLRMAVLQCDHTLQTKSGDCGEIVEQWISRAGHAIQYPVQVSRWNVEAFQYPELDQIDVAVISGSPTSVGDRQEWIQRLVEFTAKAASDQQVFLVGICFGHQIIAKALGGEVGQRDGGYVVGVVPTYLTELGKQLFGRSELNFHQLHHEAVLRLPDGVQAIGTGVSGDNHGFYLPGRLITIQGHPEIDAESMDCALELCRESLGKIVSQEDAGRVQHDHDGDYLGVALLEILVGIRKHN